jgi:hypothetical protein
MDEGGAIEISSGNAVWADAEREDQTATTHNATMARAIKGRL